MARFADDTNDAALKIAAIASRGYAYHGMGNYRAAHQTLEPLFSAPRRPSYGKDLLPIVSPLNQAIAGLAHCGEFDLALSRAEEAVVRAEASDPRYALLHACWTLGEVHTHRASIAPGIPPLERALALILDRGDFFIASNVLGSLGYLQALSGDFDTGIARMRDAIGVKPQWRIGLSRLVARLGEAYLLAGRSVEARASAGQCLELTRAHGERGYEAWGLRLLGEIELLDDAPDEAQENLESALVMSDELGMKPMAAHCHAAMARVYRRRGEAGRATPHRDQAAAMYHAMGIEWNARLLDADRFCLT